MLQIILAHTILTCRHVIHVGYVILWKLPVNLSVVAAFNHVDKLLLQNPLKLHNLI